MDDAGVTVSYASGAYATGFVILLVGVVLPMVYMVLQNKKAFKAKKIAWLKRKTKRPGDATRRAIERQQEEQYATLSC
ncbi:hypothetical protein PHYSODRAFT_335679 [Phytophthora sojae]|uniref:Uncharacterized protein n=1 Tax=Phytophthora sojae (strain P6497) TaxID=1094619 RepID=G4ZRW1_PHYSP|nr:hypothetical protein PHYSODRAFT_335679 [Phytophthora sojae]EGZ13998.1 hypothetical protein PHYSODRAFT_335679 [Phytophthora sojae]|eukprot:XP_009531427.1 hypothetical protein PHYSODRAFT_335679 [Phytophthora sojae]